MKILHVVHGLSRGGLENGVVNLLNRLPEDQFEQAVCCLDRRGEMAELVRDGIPICVLDRQRHDVRLPLRLSRLMADWGPDIVHCRNWNSWFDTVIAHALTPGRRKLVWSFHGFSDQDDFPRRRQVISRWLARRTDGLAAVCRDAAVRFAGKSGMSPERFEILYNGVDTHRFKPSASRAERRMALGLAADALVILTVANFSPVKDQAALLEAVARLPPARAPRRFLLLGDGPLRGALQAQVAALGLQDQVSMPGSTGRVAEYLAVADFFVLPSRLEGMSNAILEAMASGLPVIARAVGGNTELVVDGETGFLCRVDDVAHLAQALGRLVADPALRQRMAHAARLRAESIFSMDRMMSAYGDFYRRVAAS